MTWNGAQSRRGSTINHRVFDPYPSYRNRWGLEWIYVAFLMKRGNRENANALKCVWDFFPFLFSSGRSHMWNSSSRGSEGGRWTFQPWSAPEQLTVQISSITATQTCPGYTTAGSFTNSGTWKFQKSLVLNPIHPHYTISSLHNVEDNISFSDNSCIPRSFC